jgi:hypothetical protein
MVLLVPASSPTLIEFKNAPLSVRFTLMLSMSITPVFETTTVTFTSSSMHGFGPHKSYSDIELTLRFDLLCRKNTSVLLLLVYLASV